MRIGLVEFLLILAIASLTIGPQVALFVDRWMRRANRANARAARRRAEYAAQMAVERDALLKRFRTASTVFGVCILLALVYAVQFTVGIPMWNDVMNKSTIANIHTLSSVCAMLLFLPCSGVLSKLALLTVPNSAEEAQELSMPVLDERLFKSPAVALQQAKSAVIKSGISMAICFPSFWMLLPPFVHFLLCSPASFWSPFLYRFSQLFLQCFHSIHDMNMISLFSPISLINRHRHSRNFCNIISGKGHIIFIEHFQSAHNIIFRKTVDVLHTHIIVSLE